VLVAVGVGRRALGQPLVAELVVLRGSGLLAPGGAAGELGNLGELGPRDAAVSLHDLGRLAAVVAPQELEDRVRVLEREVTLGVALAVPLALPGRLVARLGDVRVRAALAGMLEAVEEPAEVCRRLEGGVDEEGGVRVMDDVILEVEVVLACVRGSWRRLLLWRVE